MRVLFRVSHAVVDCVVKYLELMSEPKNCSKCREPNHQRPSSALAGNVLCVPAVLWKVPCLEQILSCVNQRYLNGRRSIPLVRAVQETSGVDGSKTALSPEQVSILMFIGFSISTRLGKREGLSGLKFTLVNSQLCKDEY